MRIDGISFLPASRRMDNEAVLDEIRRHSTPGFDGNVEHALTYIRWKLNETQAKTRYWFDEGERPLDHMVRAAEQAMAQAGCGPDDVDLLIYAGNTRGFIEPGDAYFVADALGMDSVDCFDIVDACMAWTRACDVAQSHFLSGRYRTALIVNAESYYVPGGVSYPSNFTLGSLRDIAHCFSAYCGGDGATATLLRADTEQPWVFHYLSTKRGVDLCTIPLPGHLGRARPSERIGLNGLGAFTSFSSLVFGYSQHMTDSLKLLAPYRDSIRLLFPHTGGSVPAFQGWADEAGFGHCIRHIFPDYGNVGACSIPAAIALHAGDGSLARGDRIGFWIGSAGMSFASSTFIY
ncbi:MULTISPECIES: 3-oxoacyl-[acyl-carrier-protein] synthase III C-terminal domain-containing protein [Cupriavidus]|jgi:3-oxoacyl-[acyl-carrier-protein] synthase III|uniref:3-oxoacyl-[acyl-carrier-protein] synthase III C-terminal domain-containing protein n=1 Tax=unclassified Cupriavidus TaxID=2640874 RepID=UPI003F8FE900